MAIFSKINKQTRRFTAICSFSNASRKTFPVKTFSSEGGKLIFYSTSRELVDFKLNPWFVTGFTDAEGCFLVSIVRSNKTKVGWRVQIMFKIGLHRKDKAILEYLQIYFGVGNIHKQGSELFQFCVWSVEDLKVIVNHFDKYPLITQKLADYELFKQALHLISLNDHLTMEGLSKIVNIKASMNLGLSDNLKIAFNTVTPVKRISVLEAKIKDPNWLTGFVEGDGCYMIKIRKSSSHRIGFQVELEFKITQHARDEQLMKYLINYLGCGYVIKSNKLAYDYRVSKFLDLIDKIIPFFSQYPLIGTKLKDLLDFMEVASLIQKKAHLTEEGLDKIGKIKAGMNKGREFSGKT